MKRIKTPEIIWDNVRQIESEGPYDALPAPDDAQPAE
jgi:hypothetical protein